MPAQRERGLALVRLGLTRDGAGDQVSPPPPWPWGSPEVEPARDGMETQHQPTCRDAGETWATGPLARAPTRPRRAAASIPVGVGCGGERRGRGRSRLAHDTVGLLFPFLLSGDSW